MYSHVTPAPPLSSHPLVGAFLCLCPFLKQKRQSLCELNLTGWFPRGLYFQIRSHHRIWVDTNGWEGGTALSTAVMVSDLAQMPGLSTSYIHRRSSCFPEVHFLLRHHGSQMSQTVHGASSTTLKPGQYPAFLLDCGNLPKVFRKGRCTLSHPGGILRRW